MRLRFLTALTIGIGIAGLSQLLSSQADPTHSNVTEVRLEAYGWENPPQPSREVWQVRGGPTIAIDHQHRVLAGFVTKSPELDIRGKPGFLFHILRFALDGKLDLSIALPTNGWFTSGFYLGPDDRILVRANDEIQMKSDEEIIDEAAPWHRLADCPKECRIAQSAGRRTLFVYRSDHGKPRPIVMDALAAVGSVVQDCVAHGGSYITDRYGYGVRWPQGLELEHPVERWPLCQAGDIIELPVKLRVGGLVEPLNDKFVILLETNRNRVVEGVTTDGQIRFTLKLPKNDLIPPDGVSGPALTCDESGNRFAFQAVTWRGRSEFLDISGHPAVQKIEIYSNAGQSLGVLTVKVPLRRDFDYALSPDGHWLAAHEGDIVQIVKID
jgi:hypothetical protein